MQFVFNRVIVVKNVKKDKPYGIVRVELNHMNDGIERVLHDTICYFRDVHSYLVHVVCDFHKDILAQEGRKRLTFVESLIHKTQDNPNPIYKEFDVLFNRLPSNIRRAAINSAIGHVSSHETRCDTYYTRREAIVSHGHHFTEMEPGFTYTPDACPTLYKTQSYKLGRNNTVEIKARIRNSWNWVCVGMPKRDAKCLKKAMSKGTVKNPRLVYDYHKYYLEFPVDYKITSMQNVPLSKQVVLSVDRGFNHGAVASVVDASGTVRARFFDPFTGDMARIDHVINLIRKASKTSGRGQSLASLYTKLQGLKDNYYRQLSRWLVNIAIRYNVYGIVFEHLESLKRNKRNRGSLRARVHHWLTAKMRDLVKGMAFREGIRLFIVNANGTSKYAFDGSGKVTRNPNNYALCTFSGEKGKQYNCDLSASYNIAARYFLRAFKKSIPAKEWSHVQAKVPALSMRTTWTLDTLRRTWRVTCLQ